MKIDYVRAQMASDSGLGSSYTSGSLHDKGNSTDSGTSVDSKSQYNNLNPRAREFLSLRDPPLTTMRQEITSTTQCSSSTEMDGQGKDGTDDLAAIFSSMAITQPGEPLAVSESRPLQPMKPTTSSSPAEATGMNVPRGLGPKSSVAAACGIAGQGSQGYQKFRLPPGLPIPSSSGFPISPVSYPPPIIVAPFAPFNMLPTRNFAPLPVPKPRRPDAGSQQAYEAYLEWRKANEPGYALECKQRQQRRAQRQHFPQSKTNAEGEPQLADKA